MSFPYQDASLPVGVRVKDLLGRMTLQEKVGQVNQRLYGWECYHYDQQTHATTLTPTLLDHLAWGGGIGALYGLFRADPWSKADYTNGVGIKDAWRVANAVQKAVISRSRLGIPALLVEECPHGHQGLDGVSYPTNIGKGNSFDPALMTQSAQLMARELAAKGVNLALVSSLDLAKDPRWGRTEECFGEDPFLAETMSRAIVQGFQGDLIDHHASFLDQPAPRRNDHQIGVVLKHCIAQGEAQGGHNSGTVVLSQREFDDIYQPLLSGVQDAAGVMAAYNDIDGVPCHINADLFQTSLRQRYGFQGLVMADGLALDRLTDVFATQLEGAEAALTAGVDLGLWDETYGRIGEGVKAGQIAEAKLDAAVSHVLAIKFLLGLFEQPYVADPAAALPALMTQAQAVNTQQAAESITLVKNTGILPLSSNVKHLAVIGPNADAFYHLLGDYTAPQPAAMQEHTIYRELKRALPNATVTYSQGCEVRNPADQAAKIQAAVATAQAAEQIVVVLGGSSARNFNMAFLKNGAVSSKGINMDSGENVDVADLSLGGAQLALLAALAKLGKPLIAVMIQGRPYDLRPVLAVCDAVLVGWFPGQMGGVACAQLLTGAATPSGKLSMSYPLNSQQLPVYYYQRAASKQEDYYDEAGAPLFAFGSGLSYTQFAYRNLQARRQGDQLEVQVTVQNVGERAGVETVMVFAQSQGGQVIRRKPLLKAFARVALAADATSTVRLTIPLARLTVAGMTGPYQPRQAVLRVASLTTTVAWS